VEFGLSGTVSDYDASKISAIKTTIATGASVATSAVSISITPGSVKVCYHLSLIT